jgi:hypothetical protein
MSARAGRLLTTVPVVLGSSLLCALLLALPGETVITRYLPDLVTILDGAWRVAHGQTPSVDFHAATGPLAHLIPAAGYGLTGSLGAAMPTAMALVTLGAAPAIAHILASRLSPAVAIPFGLFLVLVLAVPINLGEGVTSLSFIAFYNRIGWAALAALLVMHLEPRAGSPRRAALDAAAAAFLVLVMLYTKATYGLVALAFLGLMLTAPAGRRWAAPALGVVAAGILAAELAWGGTGAYVADLLRAQAVDGSPRGSWGQILDHALGNLTDFILLALLADSACGGPARRGTSPSTSSARRRASPSSTRTSRPGASSPSTPRAPWPPRVSCGRTAGSPRRRAPSARCPRASSSCSWPSSSPPSSTTRRRSASMRGPPWRGPGSPSICRTWSGCASSAS